MSDRLAELERRVRELEGLLMDVVCHGMAVVRSPGQIAQRQALRQACVRASAYWRREGAEALLRRDGPASAGAAVVPLPEPPAWVTGPAEVSRGDAEARRTKDPDPGPLPGGEGEEGEAPKVRMPYRDD